MKYVIVKTDIPKKDYYVNQPGSHHSYTPNILEARKFHSMEDAERNACGNERVVRTDEIMKQYGF